MVRTHSIGSLVALFALAACGASTPGARLQEAAQDLNNAARFGRMDVAMDNVSRAARDAFAKRHARWGSQIRVMETELSGLNMTDSDDATLYVTVTWQDVSSADLRSTVLQQKWKSERGTWRLFAEERQSGDAGLIGDTAPATAGSGAPAAQRPPTQFQTVYIR